MLWCFVADDECEKTVSVLLDGEETMMEYFESGVDEVGLSHCIHVSV